MNKYILINQEAKGVLSSDEIVGLINISNLIDYDIELVEGDEPSFRTYELSPGYDRDGMIQVSLVLSNYFSGNVSQAKKLFLNYFVKAFKELTISSTSTVVFYPPKGISIGTVL